MSKVIRLSRRTSDRDRFTSLVQPHFDALYKAARRTTLSPQDAEDLVQEVCMIAFSRVGELQRMQFPRAWLLKVMYNKFIDGQRSSARSPVDMAPTGAESNEPDRIAAAAPLPDELAVREQQIERVLHAMRCLNADQCALVAMHDVEGLTIEELCQLTGMPAGTVKAQLHRTRKKLGRLLSHDAATQPHLRIIGGKQ